MKKIIGLALVAGCLAAMPVMAQAAEFPAVDIATKCEYANGHMGFKKDDRPDEITMKKLILTETETDGFAAGAKFAFTAEGKMQFAEKEKTVVENGRPMDHSSFFRFPMTNTPLPARYWCPNTFVLADAYAKE